MSRRLFVERSEDQLRTDRAARAPAARPDVISAISVRDRRGAGSGRTNRT